MKRPIVFSLVREQSMFMTVIMGLLTFLSVLALGIALAIGTGVIRWNNQWDRIATVQTTDSKNIDAIQKIFDNNSDKIESVNTVTTAQMQDLMRPWISNGGGALKNYLPKMWEVKFTTPENMDTIGTELSKHARFLTHASALKSSTSAGWRMILIAGFVLALTLGAIGVCISYIAQNTAMLHKRELEILNQIGASDSFIAHQMQVIVAKISLMSGGLGFISAAPILLLILSTAHSARVGLMAMMGLSGTGWLTLILLPVAIVCFAIWITRRTTLNILKNS